MAVLAVVLAACMPQFREAAPQAGAAVRMPADFPAPYYTQAVGQGQPVYRIDPARSLVVITVRRGGSLARLGHDHVIASHSLQGFVAPDAQRADLYLRVVDLSVDEPALRAEAGLDTQPGASDIAGTRANMLDKVLDASQFPFVLVRVRGRVSPPASEKLAVSITLRGISRTFDVPAQVQAGPGEMSVSGGFEVRQTDFSIVPFSILGGAIQVQDPINLRFRIHASRGDALPSSSLP